MGHTNLLLGLERKLGHLLGEAAAKRDEAERVTQLVATLPALQARLVELDTEIEAVKAVIKIDHPEWEQSRVDPVRPFVHQIPVPLGQASRKAMEVLRESPVPMITRDVAKEVLRREGIFEPNVVTLDKVANTIGQSFRRWLGTAITKDDNWPARYTVIR